MNPTTDRHRKAQPFLVRLSVPLALSRRTGHSRFAINDRQYPTANKTLSQHRTAACRRFNTAGHQRDTDTVGNSETSERAAKAEPYYASLPGVRLLSRVMTEGASRRLGAPTNSG